MKRLLTLNLLMISLLIAGCHMIPSKTVDSIDSLDSNRGYLALRFESDWKHPNNSYMGRQLALLFGTGIVTGGNIPLSSPDSLKILPLKPGSYWLALGMIDHSISFDEKLRFDIQPGEVTNLGTVYFEVGYNAEGKHFWQISQINQGSFQELASDIKARSSVTEIAIKKHAFQDGSTRIRAHSTGSGSFSVQYILSE